MRLTLVAVALALTACSPRLAARAADRKTFEPAAFAAAQKAGKSILVACHGAVVSDLQGAKAHPRRADREARAQGPRRLRDRFRHRKDPHEAVQRAQPVDAHRLQGRDGDRPLGRRHQPGVDDALSERRSDGTRDGSRNAHARAPRRRPLDALAVRAAALPIVSARRPPSTVGARSALAAGVALSFTALGLFVATIGFAIGLDADWFRAVGRRPSDRRRRGAAGAQPPRCALPPPAGR